jgi:acetylornithine/succinyldiaminopimelate/putrescine aminotransferase
MQTRQLFLQHVAQTSEAPLQLEVESATGIFITDTNGKVYIDLISGIGVCSLGHCHPEVVKAIQHQAQQYMHTMVYGEHIQMPQVALATLLADILPSNLNAVYFTNSGTEATEGAMKLAKRFTQRTEFISFKNSYHGSSQGSLSLMDNEYFTQAYKPLLPDVKFMRFNCINDIQLITNKTAAVFIELVKAECGVQIMDKAFAKAIRKRCDETGTLLIIDEIQTGFGRTGKLFAFEHFEIIPDVLLMGKAFGAGMPLGAFIADKKIMDTLSYNPVLGNITTFGGNPVCCAAAFAGLKFLLQNENLMDVCQREHLYKTRLQHPLIKDFRSLGLLAAIEFENFETMKKVMDNCLAQGVITDWFLFADNCLRIAPPLIITEAEVNNTIDVILNSIHQIK